VRLFCALLVCSIVQAHHSTAPFDMTRETTVRGVVKEFRYVNPHSYIMLEVEGEVWTLEAEAMNLLRRAGWTKDTLKPGDRISCTGARAKDPKLLAMKCFTVTFPGGRKLAATPLASTQPPELR
jgi:hypothetical protein